jgi:hypothetical protein
MVRVQRHFRVRHALELSDEVERSCLIYADTKSKHGAVVDHQAEVIIVGGFSVGFILTRKAPKVSEFTNHIADLCAARGTDIFRLAGKLRMDPKELLQMINGKVVPTKAVISGLAK